jgi:hypothetical protein
LNGNLNFMDKTEMDMLAAEGHIRANNFTAAAALINVTRQANGLPALTATASGGLAGSSCVPRTPTSTGTATQCGNMMEAMKWEKRIETAFVHFASWFIDSRGWGDLAENTPLFWAVPYQDLQARGYSTADLYGTGNGPGNAPNSFAAKGTYGW